MPTKTTRSKISKKSAKPKKPLYKYDSKSRRWRDQAGQIITKTDMKAARLLADSAPGDGKFGYRVEFNRHPDSDVWAEIERIIGMGERGYSLKNNPVIDKAAKNFNQLVAFLDQDDMQGAEPYQHMIRNDAGVLILAADEKSQQQPPQPIPTGVRSAMSLSEYYCNTQGDIWQHIETPIDIALGKLEIRVPGDPKVQQMLQDLYGPEQIDMKYVLYQNMLVSSVFGSAYPMEVPDDPANPTVIKQIVHLPPKFMWVGYHMTQGMLMPPNEPSPYAMRPWDGAPNWSKELADRMFMPQTYNAFGSGFNEQIVQGWGLPVNPLYLHPVRAKAFQWIRYPMPSISRAFRSISTRAIYQEMRRATLEGFKNQLWIFLLGTEKLPPSPNEMLSLKATVNDLSGARTGNLVWRNGLEVQVVAPNSLDDAISNEVSQEFTMEAFRDLGSNVRIVTGNRTSQPGGGGGDTGFEIDMSIWLRRLEHQREAIMEWEYLFRMRQAARWDDGKENGAARKALQKATVKFSRSLLEVQDAIKKEIVPLYSIGLYSPQTSLKRADADYDVELQNKKEFEPNRDKFTPPPSYNQTATGMDGQPTQSVSTLPKGRPPSSGVEPSKMKAAWEDSKLRKSYYKAVAAAIADLWDSEDVTGFVDKLKELNDKWLPKITTDAYEQAGGVGSPNLETIQIAPSFVNAYADNFGNDLQAMLTAGDPIATNAVQRRAMLYPQEGHKSAVVNGQNQAMRERGASHWRRVLHPELSKSGPCQFCVADSAVVHEISEPFQVMHPNDVCGTQEVNLQYFTNGLPSIEVPMPSSGSDLFEEFNTTHGKTRRKRL